MAFAKAGDSCTAVLRNLAKNFNDDFGACPKVYVQIECEILRMCEIDVKVFARFRKTAVVVGLMLSASSAHVSHGDVVFSSHLVGIHLVTVLIASLFHQML
jgi:hypothetical protein